MSKDSEKKKSDSSKKNVNKQTKLSTVNNKKKSSSSKKDVIKQQKLVTEDEKEQTSSSTTGIIKTSLPTVVAKTTALLLPHKKKHNIDPVAAMATAPITVGIEAEAVSAAAASSADAVTASLADSLNIGRFVDASLNVPLAIEQLKAFFFEHWLWQFY
mmetsp:Transcript_5207/g.10560  ORF Transcript_5207/g.10560 Transcript_5207/m.10560 type:complete len:158 (+) Transcript_5207:1456-1929(+)